MKLKVCVRKSDCDATSLREFESGDGLTFEEGDLFGFDDTDCIVVPGNSFGIMDGTLDLDIATRYEGVEKRVRDAIATSWHGELPVGASVVVPIPPVNGVRERGHAKYLCYSPTMRMPTLVPKTLNAYLACRGALVACSAYPDIETVVVPMLCVGVGKMEASRAAHQIRCAWDSFRRSFDGPERKRWMTWDDANDAEWELWSV